MCTFTSDSSDDELCINDSYTCDIKMFNGSYSRQNSNQSYYVL